MKTEPTINRAKNQKTITVSKRKTNKGLNPVKFQQPLSFSKEEWSKGEKKDRRTKLGISLPEFSGTKKVGLMQRVFLLVKLAERSFKRAEKVVTLSVVPFRTRI